MREVYVARIEHLTQSETDDLGIFSSQFKAKEDIIKWLDFNGYLDEKFLFNQIALGIYQKDIPDKYLPFNHKNFYKLLREHPLQQWKEAFEKYDGGIELCIHSYFLSEEDLIDELNILQNSLNKLKKQTSELYIKNCLENITFYLKNIMKEIE